MSEAQPSSDRNTNSKRTTTLTMNVSSDTSKAPGTMQANKAYRFTNLKPPELDKKYSEDSSEFDRASSA